MSAHTPGPWTLDPCASGWTLIANGRDVTSEPFDACDADARLLAAAPALLEALQLVTHSLAWHERQHGAGMDAHAVEQARAAIERATGGAP